MREIENIEDFKELCSSCSEITDTAFQGVDLKGNEQLFEGKKVSGCLFMGCAMSPALRDALVNSGNLVFPEMDVPFATYPSSLYTRETIYNNFDPARPETYSETRDRIIYDHYMATGKNAPDRIYESLARRLHDHGITDALMDILDAVDERRVVAVMGGHGMARGKGDYKKISSIAKTLSEKGFFLLSGGGPGAMEATHLGAWFNGYSMDELDEAISILSEAPLYSDRLWLSKAFEVIEKYPRKKDLNYDIGIPTWLYGHEPPTPFASRIAKYFANSVREEGLLALARGGIIYTPGSAGTIQEIFQDFTQNFYNTYGIVSPMIFYNRDFWINEKPVYPLVKKIASDKECDSLISITDDEEEIVRLLLDFSSGR
ncbi:MAG TPA: hypothetical protein PK358_08710 [Spirochaetota bacterium]|nr:hypothetical protein [Spirochaetota bacterium]HPJ34899.1 hypothetical protein [Spirochaetota bacterium]